MASSAPTHVSQAAQLEIAGSRPLQAVAADVLSLTKPRLSSLVMFTAAGGVWLSGAHFDWLHWVLVMLGTWGTVGGANALNCWLERDSDKYMARTANRPLPAGRMEPGHALAWGIGLAVVSLPLLAVVANLLTAVLGGVALLSYVLVYTPLKARSSWAMVAGSLPGALPPLMGWSAGTGGLGVGGLSLFAILFVWQLPHSLAISLYRKEEYRAAGLTSLALRSGDDAARAWSVGLSVLLVVVSVGPYFAKLAGPGYLFVAVALSVGFLAIAVQGAAKKLGPKWARRYFLSSLIYLVGLFVALGFDGGLRG